MYKVTENGVLKSLETWKITIPLHDNSGQAFPKQEIDTIVEEIALQFPGITLINCAGLWRDSKQTYRDENIQLIIDALPSAHSRSAEFFSELRETLQRRLRQEKVYVTKEAAKEEFVSFDEFFTEVGVEYDPTASLAAKIKVADTLSNRLDLVISRLGYETVVLKKRSCGQADRVGTSLLRFDASIGA